MERITSFSVDHTKLDKGIYISRVDDNIIIYKIDRKLFLSIFSNKKDCK